MIEKSLYPVLRYPTKRLCYGMIAIFYIWLFYFQLNFYAGTSEKNLRSENKISITIYYEQAIAILTVQNDTILDCELMLLEERDEDERQKVFSRLSLKTDQLKETDFGRMLRIVRICSEIDEHSFSKYRNQLGDKRMSRGGGGGSSGGSNFLSVFQGILPGTKWCGVDDIARDFHDLGDSAELDKCCRFHDHCPIKVSAFSKRYGTLNLKFYTESHCKCDDLFYDCLKKVQKKDPDSMAKKVGTLFFNVIKVNCVRPSFSSYCVKYLDFEGNVIEQHNPYFYRSRKRRNVVETVNPDIKTCLKWVSYKPNTLRFSQSFPRRKF